MLHHNNNENEPIGSLLPTSDSVMKKKQKYTIPEAAEIIEIENGRLREFVSRRYIKIAFPASGHGSKNYLNQYDLYQIKLFVFLLERGFNRVEASRIVKSLHGYFKPELFDKKTEHLMFACFRRSIANQTIKRKDIDRPYINAKGQVVSNKGLSPGVRIITDADLGKSFATLFLTFDDDNKSEEYDFSMISFEDILIIDMKALIKQIEEKF